jgi:hypothetical protein
MIEIEVDEVRLVGACRDGCLERENPNRGKPRGVVDLDENHAVLSLFLFLFFCMN